ncbi:hypothetical protein MC885_007491 [Smutsia gigantea]|nr:hypothetical protein MC885_007491 [Smutsia gigantea]
MSLEPKSKHHIQENSLQAKRDPRGPEGAGPAAAADDAPELPSSPSTPVFASVSGSSGSAPSSPATGTGAVLVQEPCCSPAGASRPGAQEGATSQDEQGTGCSQAAAPTRRACKDVITRKVNKLEKYKTKEQVTLALLPKIVRRKYRHLFSKILRRTTELMELVFGLELKKVRPRSRTYTLGRSWASLMMQF